MDTPQSATRRLLKTGGFSLLFHIFVIIFLIVYLKAGSSNSGGGSPSVYRVSIRSLSAQNSSNLLSPQRLPIINKAFSSKTQIQKKELMSQDKIHQPTPVPMASTPESSPQDIPETGLDDTAMSAAVDGQETGEEGS
jgi:hypothetical protein